MEITLESATAEHDPDLYLVYQAQEGQKEAFDELFERHRQFVYNVCYRILGSSDDATDATQAAFIQAYRAIGSFKGVSAFRSWLCRIAINSSTQALRHRKQKRMLLLKMPKEEHPEAWGDTVWEAILELPPDMRAVLVLFYFHNLAGEEIAQALGCSSAAVRTRLHRARAAFKDKYEELSR